MTVSSSTAEQIRRDHRSLAASLDELASLAGRVAGGNLRLWLAVERALRDLRDAVSRHHANESRVLVPALLSGNGWGIILARHLAEVHRNQMWLIDRALHLEDREARERGVRVRVLAEILRDDMRQEESWLAQLTPRGA